MSTKLLLVSLLASACIASCTSSPSSPDTTTPFNQPPEWAKEAIWYQIFVDRFYNGDPTNDPTKRDIQGAYPGFVPESWQPTPWTQDWYADDSYVDELEGATDFFGNPVTSFGQKAQLRRYGGDLQGVLDKLDYLDSLGVTAIYFNPLNDAPSLHKYDARHWRHIDRNFGPNPEKDIQLMAQETPDNPSTWVFTEADKLFLKVIEELHKREMKIILDYSWNHTGHTFWAWEDLVKNQSKSNYADWYWVRSFDDPSTDENEFDYRGWFGVAELPEIKETEYHDHSKAIVPFEGQIASNDVKEHIFAITRRWLDPNGDGDPSDGVDGYRLDVAAELPFGFWREYRKVVREVNPNAFLLGEVWWKTWPDDLLDPAPFLEGDIFDAPMHYRWYRTTRHFFNASPSAIPAQTLIDSLVSYQQGIRIENQYAMMNLLSSHDVPRVLSSLFNKNPYKYLAKPEENPEYKVHKPDSDTFETLKMMLIHQFTYVGAPHIWAGDEMGMWGGDDPNGRKPLIWPEFEFEDEVAHPLGHKRPRDQIRFNSDLYQFIKTLIVIRKKYDALSRGSLDFIPVDDNPYIFAYQRFLSDDPTSAVYVVFNADSVEGDLHFDMIDQGFTDLLRNGKWAENGKMTLPARKGSIWVKSKTFD